MCTMHMNIIKKISVGRSVCTHVYLHAAEAAGLAVRVIYKYTNPSIILSYKIYAYGNTNK